MNPHSTYANLSDEERAGLDARGPGKWKYAGLTSSVCARFWGSDGTLCSTHNGRFASDTTMRCDRGTRMIDMPDWTDFEPKGERQKLAYALMVSGVAIDVPTGGVLLDYELADRLMDALRDQGLVLEVGQP